MKKLLPIFIVMSSLLVGCNPTFAEEVTVANQEIDIDAAGAVALFLKQPRAGENVQVIKVHRSGLVFILSVAGKVPPKVETRTE